MTQHFNDVTLLGNLTRNPELKYTPNNTAVCNFGLAVNNPYTDDDDDTVFIDVTTWRTEAENASQYLETGDPVVVSGRLEMDRWENDAGENRSKISVTAENVIYLHGGSGGDQEKPPGDVMDDVDVDENEDDIPF